jgi:hypothetical protein
MAEATPAIALTSPVTTVNWCFELGLWIQMEAMFSAVGSSAVMSAMRLAVGMVLLRSGDSGDPISIPRHAASRY